MKNSASIIIIIIIITPTFRKETWQCACSYKILFYRNWFQPMRYITHQTGTRLFTITKYHGIKTWHKPWTNVTGTTKAELPLCHTPEPLFMFFARQGLKKHSGLKMIHGCVHYLKFVAIPRTHILKHSVHGFSLATLNAVILLNLLNTKRRQLYLKAQFVSRSKHFSSRL